MGLGLLLRSLSTARDSHSLPDLSGARSAAPTPAAEIELAVPVADEPDEPTERPAAPEKRPEPKKEDGGSQVAKERKRVRFKVRVTGPDFLPKAVAALEFRTPKLKNSLPHYGERTTDDYGVYEEERSFGEFEVRALPPRWDAGLGPSHWRYVKISGEADFDAGELVLTLPTGTTVTGRYVDQEGNPVPRMEVVLRGPRGQRGELATLTDKEGRYSFYGLGYGRYTVSLAKGADVETDDRYFVLRRTRRPSANVGPSSPPLIEAGEVELKIGGPHHHVYLHPPPDALASTVQATVTFGEGEARSTVPLTVDPYGIAEWHPEPTVGQDPKPRIEVQFRRSTGDDEFRTTVTLEAGKTDRFLIP